MSSGAMVVKAVRFKIEQWKSIVNAAKKLKKTPSQLIREALNKV